MTLARDGRRIKRRPPMAIKGAISVEFGVVFPDGAFAAGKFEMVRDFDRSQGDRVVQQVDKATGLPPVSYNHMTLSTS